MILDKAGQKGTGKVDDHERESSWVFLSRRYTRR
jgi:6-phosphogluconate dehydrogenase